jgi:type I restriction enzyme, S subunit
MSQQELELPKGWVEIKLNDITELIGGGTPSRPILEYFGGDIVWLTPTEIPKNKITVISDSREKITELGLKKSSAKIIPKNSVLLTSRASIGYVAIAGCDVTTNQGFASFICGENISNYFLAYWLWSKKLFLESEATGTTFKEISKSKLRELNILLPSLNEQKRIVSKIEELFSRIDSTKQSLEHTKLQLESYQYSLLRSVYSKCERKPLHTICKLISGQHILKEFCNDQKKGSSYITGPSDFGDRFPIISKWTTKPQVFGIKNDILVTVKGSGVGKLNILDQNDVCISRQLMAIRPINSKSLFIYYFLKNEFFTLQSMSKGDLPGIDRDAILKMLIGTAFPEEQEQIISQIEQGFSLIENTSQIVESTLQNLQTMKMSVLKQAFEGKLVPQDPNDESASVLLERIKSTKESQSTKQRGMKNVK